MNLQDSSSPKNAEIAMSRMLMQLLGPIVDYPEECSVDIVHSGETTTFAIQIDHADLKQMNEGNARTVKSLQTIVTAVGMKSQRRFSLAFRGKVASPHSTSPVLPTITGI